MMDKYSKIQDLINQQKMKKEKIMEIFMSIFSFSPKLEIEFGNEKTTNLIKIKIVDKSSVKFIVKQNEEKIKEEFKKIFPTEILKIY